MNTPNKLTVLRMIMVPFFVLFMLTGLGGEASKWISLAIFVVASTTDWLDGYLARKLNLVTNFGKFMDPLADKLLVCSAMICLIETGKLAAWIVKTFGEEVPMDHILADGTVETIMVNPTGYQYVLYATLLLYVISIVASFVLVKSPKKDAE